MGTRRALGFSFLDRYAGLVLSIVSSMIVARLLTPAEIGVFSVTMVFLFALNAMRDMGAGQYLIQERELDNDKIRAAWTVSLGMGTAAALVIAALAVPVAHFYAEPRMTAIMWVVALNFAITPFGSITYAWLMRGMRFETLAGMRLLSGLAIFTVTVLLAWQDFGPISMAYGNLAGTAINGLVAAVLRPRDFPVLPLLRGIAPVLRKGSQFSASSLLSGLGGAAPELIVGKMLSLEAAALYSRANGLAALFHKLVLDAVQSVAVPMFAGTARGKGDIAKEYLRTIDYVCVLGWSFFIWLGLMAHPAVRVLYGGQWDDSIELTRWMVVAYMLLLPGVMSPSVLAGLGEASLIWRVTASVTTAQALCPLVGVLMGGLTGAAMASLISGLLYACIWLVASQRKLGFEWAALVRSLSRSAAVAALSAIGPLTVLFAWGTAPQLPMVALATSAFGGALLFALGLRVFKHPLRIELQSALLRFTHGGATKG